VNQLTIRVAYIFDSVRRDASDWSTFARFEEVVGRRDFGAKISKITIGCLAAACPMAMTSECGASRHLAALQQSGRIRSEADVD